MDGSGAYTVQSRTIHFNRETYSIIGINTASSRKIHFHRETRCYQWMPARFFLLWGLGFRAEGFRFCFQRVGFWVLGPGLRVDG